MVGTLPPLEIVVSETSLQWDQCKYLREFLICKMQRLNFQIHIFVSVILW